MAFRKRRSRFKKMGRKRTSPRSSWRNSSLAPIISIGGIVLSVAALACLAFFVVIPLLSGKLDKPKTKPPVAVTAPVRDPNAILDLSGLEKEAVLEQKSVNSPFIYGRQMVYSTGNAAELNPLLKNIAVFDMDAKGDKGKVLDQITCKYTDFLEPEMSENFITFLDVSQKGSAGRICGYDRKNSKMFVIREYLYGIPKLSLSGDYLAWMQQTAPLQDKLYLCYLPTNETTCLNVYKDSPAAMSAVSLCDKELIWVENANPEAAASDDFKCVIKRMPIKDGKPGQVVTLDPQTFVFDPITNGNEIVYLDGARGPDAKLMVSIDGALPKEIDKGVINYGLGDGFVAYTKNDAVYVYSFKDGTKGKLTGKNTRGELSTVNKDMVCWYDTTDGALERDVIKYAKITAESFKVPAPSASAVPSASPSGSPAAESKSTQSPSASASASPSKS